MRTLIVNQYLNKPSIVTNGLTLHLDAGNPNSYPGTGTTWFDLAGDNNGTLLNGATFNSDNGGSIAFDGIDDYVSIPNAPGISFGQGNSFTVEVVFKTANFNLFQGVISKRIDASSNTDYMFFYQGGTFFSGTGSATDPVAWYSTTDFNQNNTIMSASMVIQSSGSQTGTKRIFKNGLLIYEDNYVAKAPTTTTPLVLGRIPLSSSAFLNGNIYQVRIYNRNLTNLEVAQNFQSIQGKFGI